MRSGVRLGIDPGDADHDDHSGPVARQPAAHVERQRADVAAGRAVDALGHHVHAVDVLRTVGERAARRQHLADPVLLDLLLGRP